MLKLYASINCISLNCLILCHLAMPAVLSRLAPEKEPDRKSHHRVVPGPSTRVKGTRPPSQAPPLAKLSTQLNGPSHAPPSPSSPVVETRCHSRTGWCTLYGPRGWCTITPMEAELHWPAPPWPAPDAFSCPPPTGACHELCDRCANNMWLRVGGIWRDPEYKHLHM